MSFQYNGPAVTQTIAITGSADVDVELGFVPGYVEVIVTTGANISHTVVWTDEQADGTGFLRNETGVGSFLSSGGITAIPSNTEGKSAGFTIGQAAGVFDAAATLIVTAFRSAQAG